MNHISKLFIFLFIFKITIFSYNSAITDITYKDEKRNRIFHAKVYYPTLDMTMRYGTGFDRIYKKGVDQESISKQLSQNQTK